MVSTVKDISQIPIERIIELPMKDLLKLVREADDALSEAKGLKDWIDGIMNLKKSINNDSDNNNNNLGGLNEQITDY